VQRAGSRCRRRWSACRDRFARHVGVTIYGTTSSGKHAFLMQRALAQDRRLTHEGLSLSIGGITGKSYKACAPLYARRLRVLGWTRRSGVDSAINDTR
jgi:hypothetical protein